MFVCFSAGFCFFVIQWVWHYCGSCQHLLCIVIMFLLYCSRNISGAIANGMRDRGGKEWDGLILKGVILMVGMG